MSLFPIIITLHYIVILVLRNDCYTFPIFERGESFIIKIIIMRSDLKSKIFLLFLIISRVYHFMLNNFIYAQVIYFTLFNLPYAFSVTSRVCHIYFAFLQVDILVYSSAFNP